MGRRDLILPGLGAAALALSPRLLRPAQARSAGLRTGTYTYPGPGTVNTHWIETPGGGLVVVDVQRDLPHAREALEAVRATGRPVRAVLITHGHPDHYAGIGLFREAYPGVAVHASRITTETIRTDPYSFNALMWRLAPHDFPPAPLALPDRVFEGDTFLEIDGLAIAAREMGKAEANSGTAYYVPASGDLYTGDLVLHRLHALFGEAATSEWLAALDRLALLFPNARAAHPGHGESGPVAALLADQREYIVSARRLAMAEFIRAGATPEAEANAARAIAARYPYENPAGLRDIVPISVRGLFEEFSKPALAPVR